jgi:hypothetical protein
MGLHQGAFETLTGSPILGFPISAGYRLYTGACSGWGCASGIEEGYISRSVLFMYPYVFVAHPNKHGVLLVSRVATDCKTLTEGNEII